MTYYENLIESLSNKLNELDIEMRPFGDYKVELHSPLNPDPATDEKPEHFAVDIYLHGLDSETKEDSSSVCWYAIEIYANRNCTEFAPIFNPRIKNVDNYSEDDYGDILEAALINLLYKPKFIDLINDMSRELVEKLKNEIAKLKEELTEF